MGLGEIPTKAEELVIQDRRDLPGVAHAFFVKASYDCAASITAQGARILQLARAGGFSDLQVLRDAFIQDPQRVRKAAFTAEAHHNVRGIDRKRIVSTEGVVNTAKKTFEMASEMTGLTDDDLVQIVTVLFPQLAPDGYMPIGTEPVLSKKVREMIAERKAPIIVPFSVA